MAETEQRFVCVVCRTNTVTPTTSSAETPICDECFVDDITTSLNEPVEGDTTP